VPLLLEPEMDGMHAVTGPTKLSFKKQVLHMETRGQPFHEA